MLTNGHTYRDGSAIFQQDFAALVAVGQRIDLVLDNGTMQLRISTVWRNVDAVQDYPRLVASERLYDQQGPERLFLQRAAALGSKVPGCSRTSISSWPPQCPAEPNGPTSATFLLRLGGRRSPPLRMRPEGEAPGPSSGCRTVALKRMLTPCLQSDGWPR